MDGETIRRRIRAGRALTEPTESELEQRSDRVREFAGITVEELAARIDAPGLGFKTLGNIERGTRQIRPKTELPVIAQALELPLVFFTLEREQLLERIEGEGVPEVQGDVGRHAGALRPSREGQQPQSSDGEGDRKRAERE